MSYPIQNNIGVPAQRMLYQGQEVPQGYAQSAYGAQDYPQQGTDPSAQQYPQGPSPQEIAYLQELQRQQQQKSQNIFTKTWHGIVDFFNRLPLWAKAIFLMVGAYAGIRAGKFVGNNAYRVERFLRPGDRVTTMGDKDLNRHYHDLTDAKKEANATASEYDRTNRSMVTTSQKSNQAYNELEVQYNFWERKLARIGLGPKELKDRQRSADLAAQKAREAKRDYNMAATDHQQAKLDKLHAEKTLGEFRLEKLREREEQLRQEIGNIEDTKRKTAMQKTLDRLGLEVDWQREENVNIQNDIHIVNSGRELDPDQSQRTNSIKAHIDLLEQDWKLQVLNPFQQLFALIFGKSSTPWDPFTLGMKEIKQKATA